MYWESLSALRKSLFEDTNMAKIIALNCEKHNYGEVTPKDIEKIEHLNIGYTTTFTTLKDIQKCKNLETLAVGTPYNMQKFIMLSIVISIYYEKRKMK